MRQRAWVILIVDDSEDDSFLLEHALCKIDPKLRILNVTDGVEAIAYLNGKGPFADRKKFPFPTLIFIDLKMPRQDGFSVIQHLKANRKWGVIPILVFSASADLDDIKKAFLVGACAYHVKPSSGEEREKLCRLLLEYWAVCEIPETDQQGDQLQTDSAGKLGERIQQP